MLCLLVLLLVFVISLPVGAPTSPSYTQYERYQRLWQDCCQKDFNQTFSKIALLSNQTLEDISYIGVQKLLHKSIFLTNMAAIRGQGCQQCIGKATCQYAVEISDSLSTDYHWDVRIRQSQCPSNPLYAGGSQFQIVSLDFRHHLTCKQVYVRDNYAFQCSLIDDQQLFADRLHSDSLSPATRHYLQMPRDRCASISVLLQYEAMDGFSENRYKALGQVIHNEVRCLSADRAAHLPALLRAELPWLSIAHNTSSVLACLHRQRVHLFGASHMRYLWDAITLEHTTGGAQMVSSLIQKHDDASSADAAFHAVKFLTDFPAHLIQRCQDIDDHIHRTAPADLLRNPPAMVHLVLQAGAWDLFLTPLSYIVTKHNGWQRIVRTIRKIAHHHCSRFLSITWLSTVSAPTAADAVMGDRLKKRYTDFLQAQPSAHNNTAQHFLELHQSTGAAGYRTNPSIAALTDMMSADLQAIAYPAEGVQEYWKSRKLSSPPSRLLFVDAFNAMLPFVEDTANVMHYMVLGHEGNRTSVLSTLSGELLVAGLLRGICS